MEPQELLKLIFPSNIYFFVAGCVLFFLVGKTGLIPLLFQNRGERDRRAIDREDRLIGNLQEDADRQRKWRIEADARIHQLEVENEELRRLLLAASESAAVKEADNRRLLEANQSLIATLSSEQSGNARLRHELANMTIRDRQLSRLLAQVGQPIPPPFDFKELTEGDPALAELYKAIMSGTEVTG